MLTQEAAIAANRFGLGARPGDAAAIGNDARGWLLEQLEAPRAARPAPPASAQVLVEARELRAARQVAAQARANFTRSPAEPTPASPGIDEQAIREFGAFSGTGEIEAVAVDDEFGHVYYADELAGIHKYHADPDHPNAAEEIQFFGQDGFQGDREGLAIYASAGGGYIVCTDQVVGGSAYPVYSRNAESPAALIGIVHGGADETDGIEATSAPLGPRFPSGLLVVMNSVGKNFMLYDWRDVEAALETSK